ncbi:hypothetical protein SAMN05518672_111132 [Chitinophaga sp. CF118]|uniref:hypothetical protein n=1 Tax=Chitinophaga sp. CF118 TaxID=1884367 RepID=UPI0008EFA9DC|nr:hypothetical protein [Chitinophaga sp. CF118]SFE87681.1 hypothetical protein SAMN05518672_111132 [Chitinophaga sp. CF118]
MKEKFKILILLLLPVLAFGEKGNSEYRRTIVKEINNASNTTLTISNKYGKVIIHTWSKNVIKSTVVITGFGKSVDEAKDVNSMVDITTNTNGNTTSFQTVYNPSGSGNKWFSWGSGKKDSKDYVNIDYELYVPEDLTKIVIENNFGDVIADVLSFPAVINMNYCNYDIKEAQKSLEMHMNYCQKGKVGKADALIVKANYSNIRSESVGSLMASSNYSEYTLGSVGKMEVKGNYDEYTISKVGVISSRCTYTNFKIGEVLAEITANLVYGDLSVKSIGQGFKKGDMHLTYTDINLGFQQNVAFQIRVNLTSGDLNTGDLSFKNVTSIKKSSQLSYTGSTAGAGDQSPLLAIQGVYSDIDLDSH